MTNEKISEKSNEKKKNETDDKIVIKSNPTMSSGGTTWASLGRRDERKKDDFVKRAVVGGEIKTKEKKRDLKNVVEEGHPNHHRRLEDVVEKKLKSAHNQNKQTNISFARIDRKEHFETIKKATRVETIELSECDLVEEEEDDDDSFCQSYLWAF